MSHNISCNFCLHSHTFKTRHTISVAISLWTAKHLKYTLQYQFLIFSALPHIYNMPQNISCYFCLHSHTSTICRTISVTISHSTPTHLQYAVYHYLLIHFPLPHIYNIPYNISCYFPLHSHIFKICGTSLANTLSTPTHLQHAVQYQLLFLYALTHIYNMPYNISCYFSMHSHTSTIAVKYQLLIFSPLLQIYNIPYNIICYFCLHSHTSKISCTISVPISLSTPTNLQCVVLYQLQFFSLNSYTSAICLSKSVANSLSTPAHQYYAVQYQLLILCALLNISNMPYKISCYYALHSHTSI